MLCKQSLLGGNPNTKGGGVDLRLQRLAGNRGLTVDVKNHLMRGADLDLSRRNNGDTRQAIVAPLPYCRELAIAMNRARTSIRRPFATIV